MATFERSFDECFLLAYRVAYRVTRSEPLAEEIAQETLTRAFARWTRVADRCHAWLATVALRLAIDTVRAAARHPVAELRDSNGPEEPDVVRRLVLAEALARLPKRQQEAIACRYLVDLSIDATANFMGVTQGAVKQHVSRGLAAMRRDLIDESVEGRVDA